jgi:hypothetical protein
MPFTEREFLDVLALYNKAVWPLPIYFTLIGLFVMLSIAARRAGARSVALIVAAGWFWTAIAYHLRFFTTINPAAYLFAALAGVGAMLFLFDGFITRRLEMSRHVDGRFISGIVVMFYALAIYPLTTLLAGHQYPEMATFGLPCPTTIFTIGVLLTAKPSLPRRLFVVPLLWSAIATVAAMQFGMIEDYALPLAALAGVIALVRRRPAVALQVRAGA